MLANAVRLNTHTYGTIWQTPCLAVNCCCTPPEEQMAPRPHTNEKGQQVEDSDEPCAQTMRGKCGCCDAASCGLLGKDQDPCHRRV
jgi:hypothetical protein